MNANTRLPGRPDWAAGPLYQRFLEIFPEYRTQLNVFDVQRLKNELGKSHEAIYKWLRQGKITPDNAREIVRIAANPANVAALAKLGRKPPEFEDFCTFF